MDEVIGKRLHQWLRVAPETRAQHQAAQQQRALHAAAPAAAGKDPAASSHALCASSSSPASASGHVGASQHASFSLPSFMRLKEGDSKGPLSPMGRSGSTVVRQSHRRASVQLGMVSPAEEIVNK